MRLRAWRGVVAIFALALARGTRAWGQQHHHHPAADTTARTLITRKAAPATRQRAPAAAAGKATWGGLDHAGMGHDHASMGHDHASMGHDHASMTHTMNGMLGPYPMSREASGTSWQPDFAMHEGIHAMRGPWTMMLHGFADLVSDHQGGARGDDKVFSNNMVMGMAQRPAGAGTLGLRAMLSAEPATIGKEGYPLLLQTGETADGRTHLIDRQHPHDLFMELSGIYSVSSGNRSLFVYGGLPGEPALGPPAFMHRFSGIALPEAPITHHWLDSSHITFGVLTAGAVLDRVKLEASAFRGREPDQDRWNIETPKLDSHAFRVSLNPAPAWSLQASYGRIESPEQLAPEIDVDRTTASAIYAHDDGGRHWETTFAWGRNRNRPGRILDAFLIEAAAQFRAMHTLFARAERVEKDELFEEGHPLHGRAFEVGKVSVGYRIDPWRGEHVTAGIGALASLFSIPTAAEGAYGTSPTSALVFAHVALK
jgi:hypothetical protein